jgi:hypothetical protein
MDQAFVFEDFISEELNRILDLKLKEQGYGITNVDVLEHLFHLFFVPEKQYTPVFTGRALYFSHNSIHDAR